MVTLRERAELCLPFPLLGSLQIWKGSGQAPSFSRLVTPCPAKESYLGLPSLVREILEHKHKGDPMQCPRSNLRQLCARQEPFPTVLFLVPQVSLRKPSPFLFFLGHTNNVQGLLFFFFLRGCIIPSGAHGLFLTL